MTKRNFFRWKKDGKIGYRVTYRKNGIVTCTSCSNKWEVNALHKKYKEKEKYVNPIIESKYHGGIFPASAFATDEPKPKKIVDTKVWHEELHPDSYYIIFEHHLRYYTKNGTQRKMMDSDNNKVWEIQIPKFYLVGAKAKPRKIAQHPLVDYCKVFNLKAEKTVEVEVEGKKQIRHERLTGANRILAVFPVLNYRDNFIAFDHPKLGFMEVSSEYVSRFWNIGYEYGQVFVHQIPKTENKQLDSGIDKYKFEQWKKQHEREKILKSHATKIDTGVVDDEILKDGQVIKGRKTKNAFNRKQSTSNKMGVKIDNRQRRDKQNKITLAMIANVKNKEQV